MTSPAARGGRPPTTVVAAVALAGIQALFCLLPGLSGISYGLSGSLGAFVIGAVYLVLSATTVYGSVLLLRGRDARLLRIAGFALVAVWLVSLGLSVALAGVLDILSVLLLVLSVGIVVALRRPEVRDFAG